MRTRSKRAVLANLHKRTFVWHKDCEQCGRRHGTIGITYRYMIVGSAPPMLHLTVRFVIAFQLACAGSQAEALGNTVIEDGAERNMSGDLSLLPSGARRTEPAGLLWWKSNSGFATTFSARLLPIFHSLQTLATGRQ
jgi:hypothetical protein